MSGSSEGSSASCSAASSDSQSESSAKEPLDVEDGNLQHKHHKKAHDSDSSNNEMEIKVETPSTVDTTPTEAAPEDHVHTQKEKPQVKKFTSAHLALLIEMTVLSFSVG